MPEEKNEPIQKQIKTRFVEESSLSTFFVNVMNVSAGPEEFYLTFGTLPPLEVKDVEDLNRIDTVDAKPLFRCAVTRTVMKQMIDVMEAVYNRQMQQIDALHGPQEQEARTNDGDALF